MQTEAPETSNPDAKAQAIEALYNISAARIVAAQRSGKITPGGIPLAVIYKETLDMGGGSILYACKATRAVRLVVGHDEQSSRHETPAQKAIRTYHAEAHGNLLAAITKLAHEVVDGVNSCMSDHRESYFTLQEAKPIPAGVGAGHTGAVNVMAPKKETPDSITEAIGSFEFKSTHDRNPENRQATVRFEGRKIKTRMTSDEDFYPEPVITPLISRSLWKLAEARSEEAVLAKARGVLLDFMQGYNPEAVQRYKRLPQPENPADKAPEVAAPELVAV